MFTLIFAIIFGVGLTLFATQNTNGVTITLAGIPLTDVPLWIIVVTSLVVGLIFASFFNVINIVTSKFKLHDKDKSLKGADSKINHLKDEINKLKEENATLRTKTKSSSGNSQDN